MNTLTRVKLALEQYPDLLSMFQAFADPRAEIFSRLPGILLTENSDNTFRVTAFGETLRLSFSIDFRQSPYPLGRIDTRWLTEDETGNSLAILIRSTWFDQLGNVLEHKDDARSANNIEDPGFIGHYLVDTLAGLISTISKGSAVQE